MCWGPDRRSDPLDLLTFALRDSHMGWRGPQQKAIKGGHRVVAASGRRDCLIGSTSYVLASTNPAFPSLTTVLAGRDCDLGLCACLCSPLMLGRLVVSCHGRAQETTGPGLVVTCSGLRQPPTSAAATEGRTRTPRTLPLCLAHATPHKKRIPVAHGGNNCCATHRACQLAHAQKQTSARRVLQLCFKRLGCVGLDTHNARSGGRRKLLMASLWWC